MLGNREATATIAVKNMKAARQFYEGALGLTEIESGGSGAVSYQTGTARILVYESRFAGTNKATAATWMVGNDLEDTVKSLKAKGVPFEHYDLPGSTRHGDVHVMGNISAAWFKDPDGNIHSLVNR